MLRLPFVFLICSMSMIQNSFGQKVASKDTLYYLIDTIKTPNLDRMVEIGTEVYYNSYHPLLFDTIKYVKINCPCLPFNYYPSFTVQINKTRISIGKQQVYKIKFVSLSTLLDVTLKDYKQRFAYKYTVIMVERIGRKYFKYETKLTEYGNPSIDVEVITPPK